MIRSSGGKMVQVPWTGEKHRVEKCQVPLSWLGDDQELWGKSGASPQGGYKHRVEKVCPTKLVRR